MLNKTSMKSVTPSEKLGKIKVFKVREHHFNTNFPHEVLYATRMNKTEFAKTLLVWNRLEGVEFLPCNLKPQIVGNRVFIKTENGFDEVTFVK